MIDLSIVSRAFTRLARRSEAEYGGAVVTLEDAPCCVTCGYTAAMSEIHDWNDDSAPARAIGYVFYHEQDTADCKQGGNLWLAFGTVDESVVTDEQVAHLAVECLRAEGLAVEWCGSVDERICVKAPEVTV
jgi:hypothetical protein